MAPQDELMPFQCHFCPKTFGRQEHLARHVRAHTREKPYGCRQCNKSFTRQDVLQRHQATHSLENSNEDIEVRDRAQVTEEVMEDTSVLMENNATENGGEHGWIANQHQPIPMTSTGGLMTATSLPESMFQINDLGDFAVERTMTEPTMGASSINWLSDSQYLSMWESQLSAVPDGLGPVGYAFTSGLARPNPISPWISNQYNDVNSVDMARSDPGPTYAPSPMAAESPHYSRADSLRGSSVSKSTDGTLYVEGTMARAPFGGQLLGRNMNQPNASHAAEAGSSNGAPDSLEVDSQTDYSHYVSNELYSELVSVARGHAEIHSQDLTTATIPPIGHIRCFVRLYYERLLEAILDDRLQSVSEKSNQDSHGTWIPGSSQSRVRLDFITLQAFIISMIDRLHSGQKAVTERALSQMFLLVEQCRSLNLLSRVPPKINNETTSSNGASITEWLRAQSELRTGLMVWILDSIVAYEFDCPHLLQLHEVKTALPCQEGIWDEPTWESINGNGCRQG
ncbi:hypothetical protein FAUST_3224 [Fusarium austroamericanum]|uniref:C2H2-type domain-containing protein n=1 Tax=Fusarium austroamericanum TaxID=282268 RepID=A0AAN6C594_FUSAU|nr:hypothetical protein FAUST_3224 [Fusarium austroamericanum]